LVAGEAGREVETTRPGPARARCRHSQQPRTTTPAARRVYGSGEVCRPTAMQAVADVHETPNR
jgi:hypothetical protein